VDLPARETGAEQLVRSYLAAFGPATRQDLLRFAGVRVGDLRAGLEAVELRTFRDERDRELLDLPRAPLPDADVPAPLRFLPKWDSALLAYAPPERARILAEQHRATVIRNNGDVLPTVLVDGFVAATWNVDRKGALEVNPLRRLTKAERNEIDEEGERLVGVRARLAVAAGARAAPHRSSRSNGRYPGCRLGRAASAEEDLGCPTRKSSNGAR
jgi:hypothetical protein